MNLTIKKRPNSPDFVLGSFGCKFNDLKEFVNSKGYINFDLLKGKDNGSMYVKVSDYGLEHKSDDEVVTIGDITEEELPF